MPAFVARLSWPRRATATGSDADAQQARRKQRVRFWLRYDGPRQRKIIDRREQEVVCRLHSAHRELSDRSAHRHHTEKAGQRRCAQCSRTCTRRIRIGHDDTSTFERASDVCGEEVATNRPDATGEVGKSDRIGGCVGGQRGIADSARAEEVLHSGDKCGVAVRARLTGDRRRRRASCSR